MTISNQAVLAANGQQVNVSLPVLEKPALSQPDPPLDAED